MFLTRRFILAAAALGASFSSRLAVSLISTEWSDGAAMRLRALLPAPASAREIGRIYLAQYPEERGIGTLTRLILSSMSPASAEVAALDPQALPAMVTARVRADFEKGFTVEIGGWILSRTEARVSALWT
jgi:hypothetical protein